MAERGGQYPRIIKIPGHQNSSGGRVATFYHWNQFTGQGLAGSWNQRFYAAKNIAKKLN
jgi:hypothetical protein